ncbi:sialate:O-sulfotransferase 2-like isoform X2 [Styela clava]
MLCDKMRYNLPIAGIVLILILLFSMKTELRTSLSAIAFGINTKTSASVLEYTLQAEAMIDLDPNTFRCEVHDMGCFILVPPSQKIFGKKHPKITDVKFDEETLITREICINSCFQKQYTLSAINAAQNCCMCSTGFEGFISSREIKADTSFVKAEKCRSSSTFHVYSKIRDCEKGVSKESLQQNRVGCLDIPKTLNQFMIALSSPQLLIEQCILNCEMRKYTFAIPVKQKGICLCSDSYSLFRTVDNMTQAMARCGDENNLSNSDEIVEVYRTTVNDEHCEPRRFLPPKQNKPILLASYPGSGNTWIRHLIEIATGIYTGSVYNDADLYEGDMLGGFLSAISGRTIVIKDHLFGLKISIIYTMAVLLIRNPYDATLAEFMRMNTQGHIGVANNDIFRKPGFKAFCKNQLPSFWFGITKVVLKTFVDKVVVVYFEDLVKNPIKEIRRIVEFLPKEIVGSDEESLERRLMCLNLDLAGKFKRPPRKLNSDPFDELLRGEVDKSIENMNELLLERNHPPLPHSYFYHIMNVT